MREELTEAVIWRCSVEKAFPEIPQIKTVVIHVLQTFKMTLEFLYSASSKPLWFKSD